MRLRQLGLASSSHVRRNPSDYVHFSERFGHILMYPDTPLKFTIALTHTRRNKTIQVEMHS